MPAWANPTEFCDHRKILLDKKAGLEEVFAELGTSYMAELGGLQTNTDRVLPGFRALMNLPALPAQVIRTLTKSACLGKSN